MFEVFVKKMCSHLKKLFPICDSLRDAELERTVRDGINKAEEYGVKDDFDVQAYLECIVRHGPAFDVDPRLEWAGELLRNNAYTGERKMRMIREYAMFVLKDQS